MEYAVVGAVCMLCAMGFMTLTELERRRVSLLRESVFFPFFCMICEPLRAVG